MSELSIPAKPTVSIVSVFGRGNWLAVELQNLGFQVTLVEISESLGRWAPEDWEGPLGYFQTDGLSPMQRVRLDEEDYSESIEEGFVLWLKSGPIDLRGPHSTYLLERSEIPAEVVEYVRDFDKWSDKKRSSSLKKSRPRPFQENWFAALAHSLGSNQYLPSHDALDSGRPLPLFAPYAVRRVSRRGAEKSTAWMKSAGVQIHESARVTDISIDGSKVLSLEVKSLWSGVLQTDHFIWMLTSLETARLGEKFITPLYSGRALKPSWVWARYRVEIDKSELGEVLPLKVVVIEDLGLPWTHANLQLLQRTASPERYDVWVRLPEVHRFQKGYIEDVGGQIVEVLRHRLPGAELRVVEWPQEYHYDEATLGPARFGLFTPEDLASLKELKRDNLYFHSAEFCEMVDWNGQFQHQSGLLEKLKAWKTDLDRKIEKQKARDLAKARSREKENS
jgi:hypothetical protein